MERISHPKHRSDNFLSDEYEQHLSPFGKKVMAALFKLKEETKNRNRKRFYSETQARYQNKRVLQFIDHSPPKSIISYKNNGETNTSDVENTNIHKIDNSPLILTASDLFTTSQNDSNLQIANKIMNSNKKNNSSKDFPRTPNTDINTNNVENNENLVNWGFDQIFDINDIFCSVDNNIDKTTKIQLDTKEFSKDNVTVISANKIAQEHNISFKCNEENIKNIKEPVKRKNIRNVQSLKAKTCKINTLDEKNSYRKVKYTATVENWLNEAHSKNKEVGDHNIEETRSNKINICRSKEQKNKKIVQAQLANKDGIMKYSKPIGLESNEVFKKNKKESKDGTQELTSNKSPRSKVVKDKKVKSKFIAPIKSQIPVKDIEYPVNVINDSCFKDFDDLFKIGNEEIVIILVFSNGSCQLNSQYTENTCIPEALFFNVRDTFYYLKSPESCFMNAFCRFISSNTLICYDAKKLFIYIYNLLGEFKMPVIFDAKIGGSLISPDEPPATFADLQKLLSITADYTIASECVLQRTAWYTTILKESANKLRTIMVENGVYSLFVNIEMKILPIIADMERRGICVNLTKLKSMEGALITRMKEVEAECYEAAGKTFQINSALQVRTIIYDELKLDAKCNVKIRETASKGAKSTSETMLQCLSAVHPLPRLILEYRHLHKAYATFVTGISQHVVDGIVKPTWDQTAAVTGRIAANNPNLQAIPRTPFNLVPFPKDGETESPRLCFRSVYTSRPGYCLLAADFKHLECRVFAWAAQDQVLLEALRTDDLFTVLAAKWLSKSEGSISVEERSLTKRVVYASLYGAGARSLRHVLQRTDPPLALSDSFNKTFPSLKNFGKSVISKCKIQGGRVTTPSGRTRFFKNIFSTDFALKSQAERRAVNFIIQGTAADLCKRAMWRAHVRLRQDARLALQLHDELVWEVRALRLHAAAAIIKSAMESCGREFGLELVLPVSMYYGDNWGEMEEFTPRDDNSV